MNSETSQYFDAAIIALTDLHNKLYEDYLSADNYDEGVFTSANLQESARVCRDLRDLIDQYTC